MIIGEDNAETNIVINGENYLCVQIHQESNMGNQINERITNTSKMYYVLSNKFMGKNKQIGEQKWRYMTLTYGSESQILTNAQISKIQAMEMKYLRQVLLHSKIG